MLYHCTALVLISKYQWFFPQVIARINRGDTSLDSLGSLAAVFNTEETFSCLGLQDNDQSGAEVLQATPRISDESSFNLMVANYMDTQQPIPGPGQQQDNGPSEPEQRPPAEAQNSGSGRTQEPAQAQPEPMELDPEPGMPRASQSPTRRVTRSQPSSSQEQQLGDDSRHSGRRDPDSLRRSESQPRHSDRGVMNTSSRDEPKSSDQVSRSQPSSQDQQRRDGDDSRHSSRHQEPQTSQRVFGSQPSCQDQQRRDSDDSRHSSHRDVNSSRQDVPRSSQQVSGSQATPEQRQRHQGDVSRHVASQSQPLVTVFAANADVISFEPDSNETLEQSSFKVEGKRIA